MPFIILGFFALVIFFGGIYLTVKAAINNSELLREIKILLMKPQNENDGWKKQP